MSRSYRKTLVFGHTTSQSEKPEKRQWHGRMRCAERTRLHSGQDLEAHLPCHVHEVSDTNAMSKDGKERTTLSALRERAEDRARRRPANNQAKLAQRYLHKELAK